MYMIYPYMGIHILLPCQAIPEFHSTRLSLDIYIYNLVEMGSYRYDSIVLDRYIQDEDKFIEHKALLFTIHSLPGCQMIRPNFLNYPSTHLHQV